MSEKITGKYLTDRLYKLQMILKDNSEMMDEAGAEIIILRRKNITLRASLDRAVAENEAWRCGRLLYHEGRGDYELVVNVGLTHDPKIKVLRFDTIDEAVDALMEEHDE